MSSGGDNRAPGAPDPDASGFEDGFTVPEKDSSQDTVLADTTSDHDETRELSGPNRRRRARKLPEKIGNYRVIDRLGVGGMAEVFLAEQSGPAGFTKKVVIKRVLSHLSEDDRFVDLFLREARLAARLSHPNVVQIYELGEEDGDYYLVMEHIDGMSLHELAKTAWAMGRSLPMELVVSAIADAARGLHHAHELLDDDGKRIELVHRDISPDNLMISKDGVTKVLDFGIARDAGGKPLTKTGEIKGKVPYMAPEQIKQAPIDRRTDLYALGVSLYWMLTGKRPFDADAEILTLNKVLTQQPEPPSKLNPSIPSALDEMILRLLAKEPRDRPATGEVLHDLLKNLLPAGTRSTSQFVREVIDARDRGLVVTPASSSDILAATPTSSGMLRLPRSDTPHTPAPAPSQQPMDEPSFSISVAGDNPPLSGQISTAQLLVQRSSRRTAALVAAAFAIGLGAVLAFGVFDTKPAQVDVPPPPVVVEVVPTPPPDDEPAPPTAEVTPPPVDAPVVAPPAPDDPAEDEASDDGAKPTKRATRPSARTIRVSAPSRVRWLNHQGKTIGRGSGTLSVSSRDRTVTAVDAQRGARITVPVSDDIVFEKLPTGKLDVRVFPYAKVFLGKQALGQTPVPELTLPAGSYSLILEKDGVRTTKEVTVRAGQTERVKVNLSE